MDVFNTSYFNYIFNKDYHLRMKKPIIQIRGLNFSYPDNTKALKDINLDIYEGESIGVIGPNGAGKSTLLLHLNGILNGSGSVRVFDLEMNQKNLMQIRKNVGLVFQDPDNQLFMLSGQ